MALPAKYRKSYIDIRRYVYTAGVICPHCGKDTDRPRPLTAREAQIFGLMCSGITRASDIADHIGIAKNTVKQHIVKILKVNGKARKGELLAAVETERLPLPGFLSPRKREIARRVIAGQRYREIAADLNVSEQVVKNHTRVIFDKLGIDDRFDMALRFTAES